MLVRPTQPLQVRGIGCLLSLFALLLAPELAGAAEPSVAKAKPMNVLFIVADDLRPELGCYGSPALTPNIDKLAQRGVVFNRAYCQQSVCNPSRSSFLTGLRPDTLHIWVNSIHFRELNPDVVTLPQWFKQHGYVTRDVGKIFHNWVTKEHGDRRSWSAPEFLHYENHNSDKPVVADEPPPPNLAAAPKCEMRDVPDNAYFDGRVADEAVRVLGEIKDEPFFLALGFWKPHSPFNSPKKYWDRYERERLPVFDESRPTGTPEVAFHDSRELRGSPPNQLTFTPEQVAEIRHGYFANTAYMDTQLGKVLAELDRLGLTDSTLVVFVGDHGYHLGEHGLWAKTSCFELDARVPLIISRPDGKNAGTQTENIVELVDLFPTLTELCGLPTAPKLDGKSVVASLDKPAEKSEQVAYSQHPRPPYPERTKSGLPDSMGYSVRTPSVRYTEWREWETGKVIGRELYDHAHDDAEMANTVEHPADPAALAEAVRMLHKEFPTSTPPAKR